MNWREVFRLPKMVYVVEETWSPSSPSHSSQSRSMPNSTSRRLFVLWLQVRVIGGEYLLFVSYIVDVGELISTWFVPFLLDLCSVKHLNGAHIGMPRFILGECGSYIVLFLLDVYSPVVMAYLIVYIVWHVFRAQSHLVVWCVRARRRDGARRNSDAVPRRLDGVQAQPRRALSTASATASLGEVHLPPAPLLRLLYGTWPWLYWCGACLVDALCPTHASVPTWAL